MIKLILYVILFIMLTANVVFLSHRPAARRFGLALLALTLLFEVFVCNFHSFHLALGDYEELSLTANSEQLSLSSKEGNSATVEIKGLSRPVGTVYLQCDMEEDGDFKGTPYITVRIDAKDSTQQGYYRSAVTEGQIIRGNDRTSYLVLNLSGDVTDLRIRLTAKAECELRFTSLTLNKSIPMEPSPLRLLLIFGAVMAVYALITSPSMRDTYENRRCRFRVLALLITLALILCAVAITFLYQYDRTGGISGGFEQRSGNQITQELVDAFEAGQSELLEKPSEELLSLNNPYDWSERSNAGIYYKWDHLLYEGKYYSYYGIAPVLLLFLPYHMITGFYFPTPEAVLIFGALGILFLSLAYLAFCELFCKRIPLNMLLSGLLICQLCSGVWYNFCSPLFYEIAQTAGFCFTCAGIWLLLRSGVIGNGELRFGSLCFSSICLSLAVLSRPTLALYCFAALIPLFFGLLKCRRMACEGQLPGRKRPTLSYLAASLLPFVLIGGLQMLYNYERFGSVLEFGIQYSLTINDFTRSQYHTDLVMIGMHNFLFAFPHILPEFPYVFTNFSDLAVNGYYYIANRYAVGLFCSALPTWGYLAAIPACRSMTREERRRAIPIVAAACVLVPLGIIFSIWESGYGVRYCTDFAWQFILGAMGILFLLYARRADGQVKRIMQWFFVLSTVVAFLCSFGLVYAYMSKSNLLETAFLNFERIFDFWL